MDAVIERFGLPAVPASQRDMETENFTLLSIVPLDIDGGLYFLRILGWGGLIRTTVFEIGPVSSENTADEFP